MSIEQNIENLEIRNANVVTFVGTSSTMVDTISGRIQCKGFQHNSNVITDVSGPHGRGAAVLKKYPEIDFAEGKFDITEIVAGSNQYWDGPSTVFQGGYSLKTTQHSTDSGGLYGWMAFDGNSESFWKISEDYDTSGNYDYGYTGIQQRLTDTNSTNHDGDHVIMGSPSALKMAKVTVTCKNSNRRVVNYSVLGSNSSGTTGWTLLDSGTFTAQDVNTATISSPTSYFKYHAFVVRSVTTGANGTRFQINSIDFYGYEEDPPAGDHSVDTTFKSRFNNPQLTGVQVFVDGKGSGSNQIAGGPVVTDTVESYDETGKYWNLTGELTSNISVEANTFLEGDQPHTVSVWFNSSNLEANVSNTCVFSISDQEKLDSVNLDLQSNTWHNLTYAYQGEGGSRVTYLDGRKVSEDQAEDTFGEYPPFAMTGYSQGGYVVSVSTDAYATTGFYAWKAFNDVQGNEGWHAGEYNDGSSWHATYVANAGGAVYDTTNYSRSIAGVDGEWLKIEMPHKLVVDYLNLKSRGTTTASTQSPKDFKILGSNDDTNWDVLATHTGVTYSMTGENHVVSATKGYKYLAIVVTRVQNATGNSHLTIGELSYHGHRENDLVRLPDPTHVLKYPHIPLTNYPDRGGPGRRGYVATSSGAPNAAYDAQHAFNGVTVSGEGSWHSASYYQTSGDRLATRTPTSSLSSWTANGGSTTGELTTHTGEWVKIQLPHKIVLSSIILKQRAGVSLQKVRLFSIVGSNDDTNWFLVHQELTRSGTSTSLQEPDPNTMTGSYSNTAFKYFAIVIHAGVTDNTFDHVAIGEWELYGTGVGSVPIQIGGGNIDKVANFRVYDKFIGEDQVNEIWDAQKDAFGRAKSSMTLQKGRLGIGTTEPEGRLAVADEPHNFEEFPPRAMTGYKTYFEGHGEFCASSGDSDPNDAWSSSTGLGVLFDKGNTQADTHYYRTSSSSFDSGTGYYIGSNSIGGISGAWVRIDFPYRAKIQSMNILTRSDEYNGRAPRDGYLLGKNSDEDEWTIVHEWTEAFYYRFIERKFTIEASKYYSSYALVATRLLSAAVSDGTQSTNTDRMNISEWKLFGTCEQGQSVLHDGQLTLTKSLTVPRIGPPLDADDTPRRDRLVVEYNTSTNPTFEGAVRDTSGRGNDGLFYGGASYDAAEKALVFDGSGDYLEGSIHNSPGEWLHSVSMWFKRNGSDSYDVLFHLGKQSAGKASSMRLFSDNRFRFNFYDGDIEASYTVINGTWYHLVFSYSGGTDIANRKIYLNGVELTVTSVSGTPVVLNLDANEMFTLATQRAIIEGEMNCNISNFKLYDCALTASEVKTLYDMGRCDEGHHVVNFSKTRVGIGLGDGEAPRSALDVREQGIFRDILFDQRSTDNNNNVSVVRYRKGGEGGNYWKNWVNVSNHYYFNYNGTDSGYFASSGPNSRVQNFTGQHRTFIKDVPFSQAGDLEGLIVSSDQNKYIKMSGGIEAGSNAITTNESLPVVSLSTTTNDKKCFGVISASEDPETREDTHGILTSIFEKEKGDTRVYINSVGEGAIWVVNTNGSLESGDYITTSNVAGHGQKQDSEFLANYTVAKITMDCDFEPATQPVQQILRSNVVQTYYLGDVHHVKSVPYEIITTEEGESNVIYDTKYTLTTTTNVTESDPWDNVFIDPPEVTYATYSNLEANVQSTYTLTFTQTTTDEKTPTEWSALESNVQSLYNKVYYQSVEEEVAADYPGAVAHTRVTDQIENTLDEYGQIQWEDHPTETEKAYKVRYLTADGTQTDEANAVHIAAFVGCTYHCG